MVLIVPSVFKYLMFFVNEGTSRTTRFTKDLLQREEEILMGPLFKLKDKGIFPSNISVSISSLYWIKVELRTNICCLKKEKEEFKRGVEKVIFSEKPLCFWCHSTSR